jgi:hypothetical protein
MTTAQLSYHQIAFDLHHGDCSPNQARQRALQSFSVDSQDCSHKWLLYHQDVELAARDLLDCANRVIGEQQYTPCLKAGFFAALFSPHVHKLVTRIEGTRPGPDAFPCQFSGTCTRLASGIGGDRYDNCLSVHAAQWLDVPQGFDAASLLWMEAGAVLQALNDLSTGAVLEHGLYILAPNDPSPYRCSMCLKSMLGKGIVDVCRVSEENGRPVFHFAPIQASLNCLTILNLADMLEKKC